MKRITFILIFAALISESYSQAFCSLRNPSSQIKKFYPASDNYKTVVGTIDSKVTAHVSNIIGLNLHKNEIGRHNLYLVKSANKLNGIVHSRSDLSKWGLIETVWALNHNLTIENYDFQRFRSSQKSDLLSERYKTKIIGKNIYELKDIYEKSLKEDQSEDINNLYSTLLASALKSIAVIEYCWRDTLSNIRTQKIEKLNTSSLRLFNPFSKTISHYKKQNFINSHDLFIFSNENEIPKIIYIPVTSINFQTYQSIKKQIMGSSK